MFKKHAHLMPLFGKGLHASIYGMFVSSDFFWPSSHSFASTWSKLSQVDSHPPQYLDQKTKTEQKILRMELRGHGQSPCLSLVTKWRKSVYRGKVTIKQSRAWQGWETVWSQTHRDTKHTSSVGLTKCGIWGPAILLLGSTSTPPPLFK